MCKHIAFPKSKQEINDMSVLRQSLFLPIGFTCRVKAQNRCGEPVALQKFPNYNSHQPCSLRLMGVVVQKHTEGQCSPHHLYSFKIFF